MTESVQEIKQRLKELGISTTTPGLQGKDRHEELINRLESALTTEKPTDVAVVTDEVFVVPSFSNVSIAEAKSRLSLLDESTATPGLTGEARRVALVQRLTNAICRKESPRTDELLEAMISETPQHTEEPVKTHGPTHIVPIPQQDDVALQHAKITFIAANREKHIGLEKQLIAEINIAKRKLKSLVNKRSVVIAGRWSGDTTDATLHAIVKLQTRAETELERLKIHKGKKASSMLVDDGSLMSVEKLELRLQEIRDAQREKAKICKNEIRAEEEANATYGLDAERTAERIVQDLNYQRSRIRKRLDELRAFEQSSLLAIPAKFLEGEEETKEGETLRCASPKEEMDTSGMDLDALAKRNAASSLLPRVGVEETLQQPPFKAVKQKPVPPAGRAQEKDTSESALKASTFKLASVAPPPATPPIAKLMHLDSKEIVRGRRAPQETQSPIINLKVDARAQNKDDAKSTLSPIAKIASKNAAAAPSSVSKTSHAGHTPKAISRPHDEEDSENEEEDEDEQISDLEVKLMRAEAKTMEHNGDMAGAERIYEQALVAAPTDIYTLDAFACFLHRKRGEMSRAEAFYRRALQLCMPNILEVLSTPQSTPTKQYVLNTADGLPQDEPPSDGDHLPMRKLIHIMLNYSTFLRRARGDLESCEKILRKALELSPNDATLLGNLAHQLAEENCEEHFAEANALFQKSLRAQPHNVQNMLWYAKLLHKNNQIAKAEMMFQVALQRSANNAKLNATAICNYAIFLYRKKKNIVKAEEHFSEGLNKYPTHRGLIKNYKTFLKDLKARPSSEVQLLYGRAHVSTSPPTMHPSPRAKRIVIEKVECNNVVVPGVDTISPFLYICIEPESNWEHRANTLLHQSPDHLMWNIDREEFHLTIDQSIVFQLFEETTDELIGTYTVLGEDLFEEGVGKVVLREELIGENESDLAGEIDIHLNIS